MLQAFRPWLHGNVVEVGFGHGSYYELLAPLCSYLGVDIDERSVAEARRRFPDGRFATADIMGPRFLDPHLPGGADGVVAINVLEHIEQDAEAIANLVSALKPGGALMLSVPALRPLYNDMDRLAGHVRRYHRDDLERVLAGLPVSVELMRYFNPLGGLGWWANKFRRHSSLDSAAVNGQIVLFDRYLVPLSRALDPLTRGFFGQSLVCVARRAPPA